MAVDTLSALSLWMCLRWRDLIPARCDHPYSFPLPSAPTLLQLSLRAACSCGLDFCIIPSHLCSMFRVRE